MLTCDNGNYRVAVAARHSRCSGVVPSCFACSVCNFIQSNAARNRLPKLCCFRTEQAAAVKNVWTSCILHLRPRSIQHMQVGDCESILQPQPELPAQHTTSVYAVLLPALHYTARRQLQAQHSVPCLKMPHQSASVFLGLLCMTACCPKSYGEGFNKAASKLLATCLLQLLE